MSDDVEHVLLTLQRGDRGEIRLSRSRYQGRTFTRLQLWYPSDSGELKPGRQVITIRDYELEDVIAALRKIAAKVGSTEGHHQRPREGGGRRERLKGVTAPSGAQPTQRWCSSEEENLF